MTLVNFNGDEIHQLLTNQKLKERLFSKIKPVISDYELQGINVDFEGIPRADRGTVLNSFMHDLTEYLHREIAGSEVSFAVPPVEWGGWSFAGLADACDYLFIMGYSFYGSWSETSGPSALLTGGPYNLTNSMTTQFKSVLRDHPEKLILGVPYFGNKWETRSMVAYAPVVAHISALRYLITYESGLAHGFKWDSRSQTSWTAYRQDEHIYQVWFDTDSSLGLKYDLAEAYELKGVGMWALGYDGSRTELWDELQRRYGTSGFPATPELSDFRIVCYPNPAHDRITITLKLNTPGNLIVTLINQHGQVLSQRETTLRPRPV
ncbi:MAG: hypothetical protein J7L89_10345 [Bacteroidales bacterium]|nr:hypothetical protein [Bacteroidales bacterium]